MRSGRLQPGDLRARHCARHYEQLPRHSEAQPDRTALTCTVPSCDRTAVTRGWCHGHYLRWSRQGDVREDVPLARPVKDVCQVEDCSRGANTGGYCRSQVRRKQLHGDPTAGGPIRQTGAGGSISHRHWEVPVPTDGTSPLPEGRRSSSTCS